MVGRWWIAAALGLAASLAQANDGCSAGSEFEPRLCPSGLPAIKQVVILQNGMKSAQETNPAVRCDDFKLSVRQVRQFLTQAGEVDKQDALHQLDWSPCYASGEVHFKDGRVGLWQISQFRQGSVRLGEGEPVYLYCPACRARPFKQP